MSILNFVTQDQIDDLSEDSQIAFMELVNHAQRKFDQISGALNPQDEFEWRELEDLRYSFMNVVIASAKRFDVEPFVSMEVPHRFNFKDEEHRQFRSNLDHYITQLILDNSLRNRSESVAILPKTKDRIRTYLAGLKDCVEKAEMSEAKREALLKRLDKFEQELEKRRTKIIEVAQLALTLWAVPGASYASYDVFNKLISNVMQAVAEAKAAEQETRQLAPTAPPKALSPPRAEQVTGKSGRYDLDDDIPF